MSPGHDGAWGQSPLEEASVTCWHGERRSDRHRPFLRPRAPGDAFSSRPPLGAFPRGPPRVASEERRNVCGTRLRALRGLCCTVDSSPWSSADLNLNFSQYCRMEWISQKVPSCGRLPQNVNSPAFLSIALPFVLPTGINSSGLQRRSDSQSPARFVGVPPAGDGAGRACLPRRPGARHRAGARCTFITCVERKRLGFRVRISLPGAAAFKRGPCSGCFRRLQMRLQRFSLGRRDDQMKGGSRCEMPLPSWPSGILSRGRLSVCPGCPARCRPSAGAARGTLTGLGFEDDLPRAPQKLRF